MKRALILSVFVCLIIIISNVNAMDVSPQLNGEYYVVSKTGNESFYDVNFTKQTYVYDDKTGFWEGIWIWLGLIDDKTITREEIEICLIAQQTNYTVAKVTNITSGKTSEVKYDVPLSMTLTSTSDTKSVNVSEVSRTLAKAPTNTAPTFQKGDLYKFCMHAYPYETPEIKIGTATIRIAGTTSYNATLKYIRQETGYSHLSVYNASNLTSYFKTLAIYYPFDVDNRDWTVYDRDGTFQNYAYSNATCLNPAGSDCDLGLCTDWASSVGKANGFGNVVFLPQCASTATPGDYVSFGPYDWHSSTVCAWAYVDSTTAGTPLVSAITDSTAFNWEINKIAFTSAPVSYLNFPLTVQTNAWHHYCMVSDDVNDYYKLYVDGAFNGTQNCSQFSLIGSTPCTDVGCQFTAFTCSGTYDCSLEDHTSCLAHPTLCASNWVSCSGGIGGECGGGGCGDCASEFDCTAALTCDNNYACSGGGDCSALDVPTCSEGSNIGCTYSPDLCAPPYDLTYGAIGTEDYGVNMLKGAIDEFMLFGDGLLTANQIAEIYKNKSARFNPVGQMQFRNINFTTSNYVNITLTTCQANLSSNISVIISNGTEQYFTGCSALNYNITGLAGLNNTNVTIRMHAGGNNSFYSPWLGGNITLFDWLAGDFDTTPPSVNISSPLNKTYRTMNITFNITLNESGSCIYTLRNGLSNYTMTPNASLTGFNATNYSLADGGYFMRAYCNDTAGNRNFTHSIAFSMDRRPPSVTITSPLNTTYDTPISFFNVTASDDTTVSGCVYTFNNGLKNYTMSNTSATSWNGTNATMKSLSYTVRYYCNDSVGNINNSQTVTFANFLFAPNVAQVLPEEKDFNLSQTANVTVRCRFENGSDCPPVTFCKITSYYPNESLLVQQQFMTYNNLGLWSYDFGFPGVVGAYNSISYCYGIGNGNGTASFNWNVINTSTSSSSPSVNQITCTILGYDNPNIPAMRCEQ